jgi:hypothetical protein
MPEPNQQLQSNWSLTDIFTYHIPALRSNGISDGQISTLLVKSQQRWSFGARRPSSRSQFGQVDDYRFRQAKPRDRTRRK